MLLRATTRKTWPKLIALAAAVALTLAPVSSYAQDEQKGPTTLRDAETENLLREYTRPILRAAGLEKQNIQIVIINDPSFNAFVADGRRIFVNFGAILQSQTPNQLIGVLAHETGHLAGGHLAKMREQLSRAQTSMIIAMLLGAGALVAGARGGNSNSGLVNAGAAAVSAPQELLRSSLLSYARQQEENADRAGVKFLTATGQSARGHVRHLQALLRRESVRRPRRRPLYAVASDAGRARRGTGGNRAFEPVLGQEGRPRAAAAPRHGARQDFGLHGTPGHRLSALPAIGYQPARPLCPRHCDLSPRRSRTAP